MPEAAAAEVRIETREDGLTVHWSPERSNFYHYFWLRSACRCEDCGDTATGKRRLYPSDVPVDIRPQSVEPLGADRILTLVWQPDGHRAHYDLDWLRDHAYDDPGPAWQPKLWDAALSAESIAHDYTAVSTDAQARFEFMRTLRDYGAALVRDPGQRGIEAMAELVGDINEAAYESIFELVASPDQRTLGNSTEFVPPHTDESYLHTPTGILVLYCVKPARDGGESILVDGFNAAYQLRDRDSRAFELLSRCPQPNHRVVPGEEKDFRSRSRVLTVDENGNLSGLRFHARALAPIDVPGDLARRLHAANYALSERLLDPVNQFCYPLRAGEAMIFDNHRVLHARKAFTDLDRHLQICNVSRERFHQSLRITARRLGFDAEARQYLPAGVCG